MKATQIMAATFVAIGGLTLNAAQAQQQGFHRTDILNGDLSAQGHEVVQVRVDFDPGVASVRHNHPGEEVAYVLEGTLEYHLEGRSPVTLKAGEGLFIPDGVAHVARNVGSGKASELATYIVRKGEPILAPVK